MFHVYSSRSAHTKRFFEPRIGRVGTHGVVARDNRCQFFGTRRIGFSLGSLQVFLGFGSLLFDPGSLFALRPGFLFGCLAVGLCTLPFDPAGLGFVGFLLLADGLLLGSQFGGLSLNLCATPIERGAVSLWKLAPRV